MNKKEMERRYRDVLRPIYESYAGKLSALLEDLTSSADISIAQIEYRAKTVESLLGKLDRKAYTNAFKEIKDFAGIRIVTYYQDDVSRISKLIRKEFDVDDENSVDKSELLAVDEFGYKSIHLVISLKEPRRSLPEWSAYANLSAEIQVRSVLQHSWAAISHKLDYKAASQAPAEIRRQLFRLSALLELADQEFSSIRDKRELVIERYKVDVHQGDLDIPLNLNSLSEFLEQRGNIEHWYELGVRSGMKPMPEFKDSVVGIDPVLDVLQAAGVSTLSEFAEMMPKLQNMPENQLREFVSNVKAQGKEFSAMPMHILTVLVSLVAGDRLPKDFDWGGKFYKEIRKALRESIDRT
jgi:putative GTP pyrophosphokinase